MTEVFYKLLFAFNKHNNMYMRQINQIKLNIEHADGDLKTKVASLLRVKETNIAAIKILHRSIDARDKSDIKYVYNVAVDTKVEPRVNFPLYKEIVFNPIVKNNFNKRPLIVGFGPAGIFAAYIFVLNNIKPIILERGKCLEERIKDTEKFFDTMELDPDSNVCFGEGGAGAFSDGKLNTNNKDKTGIYKFILETFVKFGADEKITYENLPHIGTDKLITVIKNIREFILDNGAEIRYNTKFTYDEYINYDGPVILAIGNSSRDTFRDLIKSGFDLKPKPIAVGYRVAHKQSLINERQYGNHKLPAATYKLTYDTGDNHSVYSFCMCPGGYIINSSNFKGYLSINGMSYNDRLGEYANSAIVKTLKPEDIGADSALGMIEYQEMIENKAYKLLNGYIPYNGECDTNKVFKGKAEKTDKLFTLYDDKLNKDIKLAMEHFDRIIPGFNKDYIIAGVETRTSSPVSLDRNENYECNIKGFYPCGEGFGHGGGILSAASDGVKVAQDIVVKG